MMAKKGKTKKVTKRKVVKRKTATRKTVKVKSATRTINIGCNGSDCVPDQDPFHMSPGDTIKLCAPKNDVTIHFTTKPSPFVPATNPLRIRKGTCITVKVADDAANGKYKYHVTCSNPGCGNLSADPEMIVP
jgi:hypothetical protein